MLFIIGEILLVFGTIFFYSILLAARDPRNTKWWIAPWMIESVHLFMILGSWVIGLSLLIKGVLKFGTIGELGLHSVGLIALLAVTVFVINKLHIKQRLAEYDALKADGVDVVPLPLSKTVPDETPTPFRNAA